MYMIVFISLVTFISLFGVIGEKKNEELRKCLAAITCMGITLLSIIFIFTR